eukprot:1260994-Alexandrium_andersonii.AAC.1
MPIARAPRPLRVPGRPLRSGLSRLRLHAFTQHFVGETRLTGSGLLPAFDPRTWAHPVCGRA